MKTIRRILPLVLIFALSGTQLCIAQNKEAPNSDVLRVRIGQLEKTPPDGGSAVVRDAYRQTLVRLYGELDRALRQDINELRRIQSIAEGNNPDPHGDLSIQIQKLLTEQGANVDRVKVIQAGLEVATSLPPNSDPTPRIIASRFGNDSNSGAQTLPSTNPVSTVPLAPTGSPASPVAADPPATVVVCTDSNSYADAPELVTTEVNRLVSNLLENDNNLGFLGQNYPAVFLYAVADAVMPEAENADRSIRQLKAYRYLAETARTDKQIGASAKSTGSTSAIEKPGFASLLGLAVERGAILQDINSTSLTLSTSPYLLYTFNQGGDTAQNYARAGFLNRLGVSATFNMGDANSAVLTNAKRSQLTEWSARLRLFGDRSTRTPAFQKFWDEQIEPQIQARLTVIGANLGIVSETPELKGLKDADQKQLKLLLAQRMALKDFTQAVTDKDIQKQKTILNNFVLCYLKQAVVDPIRNGNIHLSTDIRTKLGTNFIRDLGQSLAGLEGARERLNEKLDDLAKGPLATLAYVNHRVPTGSDYSEIRFLYEQDQTVFRLLKLVGNAGFSFYNKPNPVLKQQTIRDFSASLSLEGKTSNPFLRGLPDLSKITYAFTGSYERMLENKGVSGKTHNLGAAQFKLEVPIVAGFALPLSVTYTNGTEQTKKSHIRANFGFTFDMDKVWALARLLQSQQ